MSDNENINYVEFPAKDIELVKKFFSTAFDWHFTDYGSEYAAFTNSGLNGGFFQSELKSTTASGAALVVLYSNDLKKSQAKIEAAGGSIIKAIYSFPGGRRFHFCDPNGNEFAVWSDK